LLDTTGKDKKRYGFRHFFNAYMSGKALGPILAKEYGKERRALSPDSNSPAIERQEESMKASTEAVGWKTANAVRTPSVPPTSRSTSPQC
jgi:branched-chain amino acid transport system substrate-binding protein